MKVQIAMEVEVSEGKSYDWHRIVGGQGFEGRNKDEPVYARKDACTVIEEPIGQLVLAWDGIAGRAVDGICLSSEHGLYTIRLPSGEEVRRTHVRAVTGNLGDTEIEESSVEDICGLCGEPGADKMAHPEHWPGERIPNGELVHADCEKTGMSASTCSIIRCRTSSMSEKYLEEIIARAGKEKECL